MKFNGWQRIGVVASVIWVIGGAIHTRSKQMTYADNFHQLSLSNCLPQYANDCIDLAHKSYADLLALNENRVAEILIASIAPVILGWMLSFVAVKTVNWIIRGFKSSSS